MGLKNVECSSKKKKKKEQSVATYNKMGKSCRHTE